MNWARTLSLGIALLLWAAAAPAENDDVVDNTALDHELQALKEDVLALNRDLLVLEEDLLFPASRQLAVYVSMDRGSLFKLESVELQMNDRTVTSHLYSPRELEALARGGSHRLWIGNVPTGEHELVAFLTGIGPNGREYRRAAVLKVAKDHQAKALELKISDLQRKLQPEFVIREWN
jgi:hypothetical protein